MRVPSIDKVFLISDRFNDRFYSIGEVDKGFCRSSDLSLELEVECGLCWRSWWIFEETHGRIRITLEEIVSEDWTECYDEVFRRYISVCRLFEVDAHTDLVFLCSVVPTTEEVGKVREEPVPDRGIDIVYDLEFFWKH